MKPERVEIHEINIEERGEGCDCASCRRIVCPSNVAIECRATNGGHYELERLRNALTLARRHLRNEHPERAARAVDIAAGITERIAERTSLLERRLAVALERLGTTLASHHVDGGEP